MVESEEALSLVAEAEPGPAGSGSTVRASDIRPAVLQHTHTHTHFLPDLTGTLPRDALSIKHTHTHTRSTEPGSGCGKLTASTVDKAARPEAISLS